jgi:hypothetical protein
MSPTEFAAMQERENAIVQLEVSEQTQLLAIDPLQEEQDRELVHLETEITDMAEVFVEIHKIVNDQGEKIGKKIYPDMNLF